MPRKHHTQPERLGISEGDIVTPVHEWTQASRVHSNGITLCIGNRDRVTGVRAAYNCAFVKIAEAPGEEVPAHLFEQPPEVAFALRCSLK